MFGTDRPLEDPGLPPNARFLPDDYLVKVDVASMAASLEVRTPLLAADFLERAWVLPDRMKMRLGRRKWLLKRIAARHVPREVIYRRKSGGAVPMKHWWKGTRADGFVAALRATPLAPTLKGKDSAVSELNHHRGS